MAIAYRALPHEIWAQLQFAIGELEHLRRKFPEYRPHVWCYPDHAGLWPRMNRPKHVESHHEDRLVWVDPNLPDERVLIEGPNRVAEVAKLLNEDAEASRQLASVCREIEPLLRRAQVEMTPGDEGTPEGRVTWWAICTVKGRVLTPANDANVAIDDHFTTILKAIRKLQPSKSIDGVSSMASEHTPTNYSTVLNWLQARYLELVRDMDVVRKYDKTGEVPVTPDDRQQAVVTVQAFHKLLETNQIPVAMTVNHCLEREWIQEVLRIGPANYRQKFYAIKPSVMQAVVEQPKGVAPPNGTGSSEDLDGAAFLSSAVIAQRLGVDAENLRKQLERWRAKNRGSNNFIENTESGPNKPRFLYRVGMVLELLKK